MLSLRGIMIGEGRSALVGGTVKWRIIWLENLRLGMAEPLKPKGGCVKAKLSKKSARVRSATTVAAEGGIPLKSIGNPPNTDDGK